MQTHELVNAVEIAFYGAGVAVSTFLLWVVIYCFGSACFRKSKSDTTEKAPDQPRLKRPLVLYDEMGLLRQQDGQPRFPRRFNAY